MDLPDLLTTPFLLALALSARFSVIMPKEFDFFLYRYIGFKAHLP